MARLYISGPVTGIEDGNCAAFLCAKAKLRAAGHEVDIPHDLVPCCSTHSQAMLVCINELTSNYESGRGLESRYDGVALLPGWEESEGAKLEKAVAEACGIPCKTVDEWLEETL